MVNTVKIDGSGWSNKIAPTGEQVIFAGAVGAVTYGAMTAKDICVRSHIEKTKVSRALVGVEADGPLARKTSNWDRGSEILILTALGRTILDDLGLRAGHYDLQLRELLGSDKSAELDGLLSRLISHGSGTSVDR